MSAFTWIATGSAAASPLVAGNWLKDDGTNAVPNAAADVYVKQVPGSTMAPIDGLDNSGTAWNSVTIDASFLAGTGTATSYWKIDALAVRIAGAGSNRIKINNTRTTQVTTVVSTATSSADGTGFEPVRLLTAGGKLYVISGTVGVATTLPTETSTLSEVDAAGSQATVNLGAGCTLTTLQASGGATLTANSGATTLTVAPGSTATVNGSAKVTTCNNYGNLFLNNRPATDALNRFNGSTTDFSGSPATATVAATTVYPGSVLKLFPANPGHITFTSVTLNAGTLTAS